MQTPDNKTHQDGKGEYTWGLRLLVSNCHRLDTSTKQAETTEDQNANWKTTTARTRKGETMNRRGAPWCSWCETNVRPEARKASAYNDGASRCGYAGQLWLAAVHRFCCSAADLLGGVSSSQAALLPAIAACTLRVQQYACELVLLCFKTPLAHAHLSR